MESNTESFYDVRARQWVHVPAEKVTKLAVPANLYKKDSTALNYFLCAKNPQGKTLRKLVRKEYWDKW